MIPDKSYYDAGDNLTINCTITLASYIENQISIEWIKDGDVLEAQANKSIYQVTHLTLSDAGNYTCIGSGHVNNEFISINSGSKSTIIVIIGMC